MKKLLFLFCFILFLLPAKAQRSTYLKSLHQVDDYFRSGIIPAADNGWFLFSYDSLKIYKFNSCGHLEWGQKFNLPIALFPAVDLIPTQSGGFAFMVRVYDSGMYYALIVNADALGNVLWFKSFQDPVYSEVPYTLMQDQAGNFFLYGNVTLISNNNVFNSLTKISPAGTHPRFYS